MSRLANNIEKSVELFESSHVFSHWDITVNILSLLRRRKAYNYLLVDDFDIFEQFVLIDPLATSRIEID
jgi:hypothetical protein